MEYVWFVLLIAAMFGLWWFAYRMEPHWSAKDGRRFLCTAQDVSDGARPGRKKEARVVVTPDGALYVTIKEGLRRGQHVWKLVGKSPEPPKKMQVYLATRREDGWDTMLALRLPTKSRCVPVLDAVLDGKILD